MEPAATIIRQLGGEANVSRITGRGATAPYKWQYSVEKGGTGGLIPQRLQGGLECRASEIAMTALGVSAAPVSG